MAKEKENKLQRSRIKTKLGDVQSLTSKSKVNEIRLSPCVVKLRRVRASGENKENLRPVQKITAKYTSDEALGVADVNEKLFAGSKSQKKNKSNLTRNCIVKMRRLKDIVNTPPMSSINVHNSVTSQIKSRKNRCIEKQVPTTTDGAIPESQLCKVKLLHIPIKASIMDAKNTQRLGKERKSGENLANKSDIIEDILLFEEDIEIIRHKEAEDIEEPAAKSNKIKPHQTERKLGENLANKSDIIQEILLSEEDIEVVGHKEAQKYEKAINTGTIPKTFKFFHRHRDKEEVNNLVTCNEKGSQLTTKNKNVRIGKKGQSKIKNRRRSISTLTKRRTSMGNVYDFLSQSQTSDSDPNADIIKKLIAAGKVTVATNCKGKGRPIVKRRAKVQRKRVVKRENKKLNLKSKQLPRREATVAPVQNAAHDDDDDGIDNDDNFYNEAVHNDIEIEPQIERNKNDSHRTSDFQTEGTFSYLARSVITQQAGKNVINERLRRIADTQKFLEAARKFVSTPVDKKKLPPKHMAELSPITPAGARRRQMGCASPWRVDDDSHLPSVFHFGTNSSNMPSISSDNIPATPRKDNNRKSVIQNNLTVGTASSPNQMPAFDISMLPITVPTSTLTKVSINSAASSSYSSNDSNAENKPPAPSAKVHLSVTHDKNEQIFNSRQLPNPRRTLRNRSPLKTIQILDVVTLPSWKRNKESNKNTTGNVDDINKNTINNNTSKEKIVAHNESKNEKSKQSIFGFEDFMEDADDDDDNNGIVNKESHANRQNSNVNSCNASLREKLHKLKKWRPGNDELKQIATTSKNAQPPMIFEERLGKTRQRTIKQMFCSTMIQPPAASPQTTLLHNNDNDIDSDDDSNDVILRHPNRTSVNDNSQLFKDPDPELTFNEKTPHRTYVRPFKRKRKLRHNFVMFLDSDASEDEDDDEHTHHKKKQDLNTSDEIEGPGAGHKRKQRIEKSNAELNTFVTSFNDMCKDVEQYELIVE